MTLSTILLQAQAQNSGWTSIIMMVALIAIFYFFMIRPQQKRQKEIQKAREALSNGDKVMTAGGIYGKVKSIDGNIVNVEVANGVVMSFDRSAIYASSAMTQAQ